MNENLSRILNNPHRDKVLIGVGSALTGAVAGYFLGFRRGRRHTEEEVDRIDASVRQATAAYREADLPDDILVVAKEPLVLDADEYEAVASRGESFVAERLEESEIVDISPMVEEDDEPAIITSNVFAGSDDDWNYDEELKTRSEAKPYILHKDEFYEEETDYTQVTLTYYAGDDLMADEQDQLVYDYEKITGPLRFGHGSGDPKVLYVRNDKSKAEYEIVRHPGSYSEEVMGLEIEATAQAQDLRHERSPGKFRSD